MTAPYNQLLDQLVQASHGQSASPARLPTAPFRPHPVLHSGQPRPPTHARSTDMAGDNWDAGQRKRPVLDALQALANAWQADGYSDGPLALAPISAQHSSSVSTYTQGTTHWVGIGLDDEARLSYLRDAPSLGNKVRDGTPVFLQAMVLAHEIGHTVIEDHPAPLVEVANHTWGAGMVADLNDHLFGQGAISPHRQWFQEAFADVYGSMMVLQSFQFHPQAVAEVHLIADVRAAGHDLAQSQTGVDSYHTAPALHRLLAQRHAWEHLPAIQLRDYARKVVSQMWWEQALTMTSSPLPVLPASPTPANYHVRMINALLQGDADVVHARLKVRDEGMRQDWGRLLKWAKKPGTDLHAAVQSAQARLPTTLSSDYTQRQRDAALGEALRATLVRAIEPFNFLLHAFTFTQTRQALADRFAQAQRAAQQSRRILAGALPSAAPTPAKGSDRFSLGQAVKATQPIQPPAPSLTSAVGRLRQR